MADGRAYAFPFDDVGHFQSLVTDGDPRSAGITLNPFGGIPTTAPGSGCGTAPAARTRGGTRCDLAGIRYGFAALRA
jgi:hypothetical protein